MIFFTPVMIKYMKKNLDITKPRYSEQIVPVPWPFVTSRFHCMCRPKGYTVDSLLTDTSIRRTFYGKVTFANKFTSSLKVFMVKRNEIQLVFDNIYPENY